MNPAAAARAHVTQVEEASRLFPEKPQRRDASSRWVNFAWVQHFKTHAFARYVGPPFPFAGFVCFVGNNPKP